MRRWRSAAAALAVALLAAGCGGSHAGGGSASTAARPGATATATAVSHPEIGFRSRSLLDEHYRKHGREFGRIGEEAYLRLAQQLRDAPVGGPVLQLRRPDGSESRFDRRSGAFLAFDRDLVIRTFFRPNDGESYFRRQAGRSH